MHEDSCKPARSQGGEQHPWDPDSLPSPASVLPAQRALRDPSSGSLDLRVPPNTHTHSALGHQDGLRSPPPPRLLTCGPQEGPEHPEEMQHPEQLHGSRGAAEAGSRASASTGDRSWEAAHVHSNTK